MPWVAQETPPAQPAWAFELAQLTLRAHAAFIETRSSYMRHNGEMTPNALVLRHNGGK